MLINFTKMHGLGNDFMVIDAINQSIKLTTEQIRYLSDRRFGIGFDQLLLVERPQSKEVAFRYRIFNADGSEVEQCGNGARCFARFVTNKGLTQKSEIPVETEGGNIVLRIQKDGQITVNMGIPRLEPKDLPFKAEKRQPVHELHVDGEEIPITVVSMGNPHAVTIISDVVTAPVSWLGPKIEKHDLFPNRVNAGFMEIVKRDHVRLRVYERGTGETLACGTGACAAVAAGRVLDKLDSNVCVSLPGGDLQIEWQGEGTPVFMTGPAEEVYEGQIEL